MIIVLILVAAFLGCLLASWITDATLYNMDGLAMMSLATGIFALIVVLCIPIAWASDIGNLRYFEAFRQEVAQVDGGLVDATMRVRVAQENGDLARMQYWAANPLTSWFHHKDVLTTMPIVIPAVVAKEAK